MRHRSEIVLSASMHSALRNVADVLGVMSGAEVVFRDTTLKVVKKSTDGQRP